MLNAASTIFTMDIYREYINKGASQTNLVAMGRICVLVFVVIGCLIAPALGNPQFKGIFTYIQSFQGFIWPGILAIFIFGMFVPRAPRACGWVGLVVGPAAYGLLKWLSTFPLPDWAMLVIGNFLNQAAVAFVVVVLLLGAMTLLQPLKEPVVMPSQTKINMDSSGTAKGFGIVVVIVTVILYVVFW
jgi:SSS family solute:Na+ symporter